MKQQIQRENLQFGAVYIIEQDYTDEEIRRDLQNMKNCGFDLITIWPVCNAWLAKTSHDWVFTKTREVLDLCQQLGMKAIMQLIGQNHSMEFMPDSALTPEMEIVDRPDKRHNCIWANLNHPVVREYIDTFFREAILALKDHPAVYGWDVFNEAHFRSDDPITISMYQDWLKEKYGTIQNLNLKWYRRYDNFSQINPWHRDASYSVWSSLLPMIEFEKFRSVNLTEICGYLCDTVKKYDARHPVLLDGTSSHILSDWFTQRNNDETETALLPDVYGSTFYPKSWGRDYKDTPWELSMYMEIPASAARRAGKPYFINELQTHTQSVLTPGSEVRVDELRSWVLMGMFTGSRALNFWRWRPFLHGYQSTGRGLTLMDGTPNHRAKAVEDLLQTIRSNDELFRQLQPVKPVVHIAFSYDVRLYFDSLLKFGAFGQTFWAKNLEGWYKLLWNRGIPVEFVDLRRLELDGELAPVMVLPSAIRVSGEEADALRRYVEKGGTLIADGRMGTLDEWACVPSEGIPGRRLTELFGVLEVDVCSDQQMVIADKKLPIGFQSQELRLVSENAKVLAQMEDGTPAIVEHSFGKGKTIYFNNFQGLVLKDQLHPELSAIVENALADQLNLRFYKDTCVHVSLMETDTQYAVLVMNFSAEDHTVKVEGLCPGTVLHELFAQVNLTAGEETEFVIPGRTQAIYVFDK